MRCLTQLSGSQRVVRGRIIHHPILFQMDKPLSRFDVGFRLSMYAPIRHLHAEMRNVRRRGRPDGIHERAANHPTASVFERGESCLRRGALALRFPSSLLDPPIP